MLSIVEDFLLLVSKTQSNCVIGLTEGLQSRFRECYRCKIYELQLSIKQRIYKPFASSALHHYWALVEGPNDVVDCNSISWASGSTIWAHAVTQNQSMLDKHLCIIRHIDWIVGIWLVSPNDLARVPADQLKDCSKAVGLLDPASFLMTIHDGWH